MAMLNPAPARQRVIFSATLELLAETGYEALRLDAIAARAKASKATLYRHWHGKADLVVDAIRHSRSNSVAMDADTGSLRGDLLARLRDIADLIAGPAGRIMTGVIFAMQDNPDLADAVRAGIIQADRQLTRRMLNRAIARDELPAATDPEIFPEIAPALLFMRVFVNDEPLDDHYLTRVADDILIPLMTRAKAILPGNRDRR